MRRRFLPVEEPHANHERWLVSYSDFVTLLFAFFVVMYSLSQMSDEDFTVVSQSLSLRFANSSHIHNELVANNLGATANQTILEGQDFAAEAGNVELTPSQIDQTPEQSSPSPEVLNNLKQNIEQVFQNTPEEGLVGIFGSEEWLEIELPSEVIFNPGSSQFSSRGKQIIQSMANQVKDIPNAIRIEGHTDNSPLNNTEFSSHWALSTARASSVAEVFQLQGINPVRIAAIGYGKYQPITSNSSQLGQMVNRRISLVISKDASPRPNRIGITPETDVETKAPPAVFKSWVDEVSAALGKNSNTQRADEPLKQPDGVNIIRKEDGSLLFTNE